MPDEATRSILRLLGLGARARRLAIGVDASREAIRRGMTEAIVMPEDASERARERLELLAMHQKVQVYRVATAEELGAALGHPPVHGVAVLDRQLARGLRRYLAVTGRGEKNSG